MPSVMPLAESRARAEQAFIMREIGMKSWRQVRDALGFKSIGAAQMAVKRYRERNPLPSADAAMAGIVERKRVTIGSAIKSLAEAQRSSDHQAVARLVDVITRADAELARLYGLSSDTLNVNVTQTPAAIIADTRERLLAAVDAEIVEIPKEIER